MNTKIDTFYVLWILYHRFPSKIPSLTQWILQWFYGNDRLLTTQWGFRGLLCKLKAPGQCEGDYEPTDGYMMPTRSIVKYGFDQFKHKLPLFDPNYLPENDFPNIFYYPAIIFNYERLSKLEANLDSSKIQPVQFK